MTALATDTQNILNNGSFDDQTSGWDLEGNVSYDGNTYSGGISKSVRFKNIEGGSIEQSIDLQNISEENKQIVGIEGSLISIGCNNIGSDWCTKEGSQENLDPVNITITLQNAENTEVLNYNFTSDYNDGVISTSYNLSIQNNFETDNTNLTINYEGLDSGNWTQGKYGTIIDDLSVVLSLDEIIIQPEPEILNMSNIEANNAILDAAEIAEATIDDISTGIIDVSMNLDTQIDVASPLNIASVYIDPVAEMSDIQAIEISTNVDVGVDMDADISIPEPDMPEIEMPEIEMPEMEDIQSEISSESNNINDIEEVEENINENEEKTEGEINDNVGNDEISDISEQPTEEKTEKKQEQKKEKVEKSKSQQKQDIAKNEQKSEKSKKIDEKKTRSLENKGDKKTSEGTTSSEIKSNIVLQRLDLPLIVSFNKEYFENRIKDTLDLTSGEIDFYEQSGFNDKNYAQNNSRFFGQYSNTNREWDMVSQRDVISIESFRR